MKKRKKFYQVKTYRQRRIESLVDQLLNHMNTKGRITLSGFDWDKHNNTRRGKTNS